MPRSADGELRACWLSADVLLAVADGPSDPSQTPVLTVDGASGSARSESLSLAPPAGGGGAVVTVARFPHPARHREVEVRSHGRSARPEPDSRTLARASLAALDRGQRADVLDFVLDAADPDQTGCDPIRLAQGDCLLRDALREPLPRSTSDSSGRIKIDALYGLDERSYFVVGWMLDREAPIVRLTAVAPEGARVELLGDAHGRERSDVSERFGSASQDGTLPGFLCFFSLPRGSRLDEGWLFELEEGWLFEIENSLGVAWEVVAPRVFRDPPTVRARLISELRRERDPSTGLMEHIVPAVTALQERLAEKVEVARTEEVGTVNPAPTVSIVVPLYRRIDLLQHQLASFADDPGLRSAELLYVLDSPELADALLDQLGDLHEIYRVPFRVLVLSRNGGFGLANNRGAEAARGRLLMLLNSDVLPAAPGWVDQLVRFYDDTDGIGALGAKLIFDDRSLQHAGMFFRRETATAGWENAHYFKGLGAELPAANVARPVPAVTAACLMIDRRLYLDQGGLSSSYVQGDYEDSDLCLRLLKAGKENWYLPTVELYHLEGQSYSTAARQANARYNSWLQTRRWGESIGRLMADPRFVDSTVFATP